PSCPCAGCHAGRRARDLRRNRERRGDVAARRPDAGSDTLARQAGARVAHGVLAGGPTLRASSKRSNSGEWMFGWRRADLLRRSGDIEGPRGRAEDARLAPERSAGTVDPEQAIDVSRPWLAGA